RAMAHGQGPLLCGCLPAWGILYQPVAFLIFMAAGVAESKRIPFDLPEAESELVSGYFTEYSGPKHLMFMMSDFVEVVLVACLVTTLFFGGWQVPYLVRDGFHLPWGAAQALPSWAVALLQVTSFALKLVFFTCLQIVVRWTLPRFRYDQLMRLGWQGLLPVTLANVVVSDLVIVLAAALAVLIVTALRRAAAPATANLPAGFGETAALGRQLFTVYLLPFELTSLLLLVAIVGAVALAKKPT